MKILIVDDETLAISRLQRLLEGLGEIDIASTSNPQEAIELSKNTLFEVAFLDIKMPQMEGMELARAILSHNPNIFIVFQTAYDSHAIEAYEIGAVDYLLKPYSKEQVARSLGRAKSARDSSSPVFMVKDADEHKIVESKDIFYVEAELAQTVIRTKEWFLYYPKKISQMEELLSPYGFFRIHRSYLINLSKVKNIVTAEQSRLVFYFDGIDESVESSKDGAKIFRQKFDR